MKPGKAIAFYVLMGLVAVLVIVAVSSTIIAGGINFDIFKKTESTDGTDTDKTVPLSSGDIITTDKNHSSTEGSKKTTDKIITTEPKPKDNYTVVPIVTSDTTSVMTFDSKSDKFNSDEIAGFISNYKPTVWCTTGITAERLEKLIAVVKDYNAIGIASEKTSGVYNAIFYDPQRLDVYKSETVWLSSTPGEVSKHPSAETYDICTYALFTEKESGKQFAVFCANLDKNETARSRQLTFLYKKYQCYIDYFPTVVAGNFRFSGDETNYNALTNAGRLTDCEASLGARDDIVFSSCFKTNFAGDVSYTGNSTTGKYYDLSFTATQYTMDFSKPRIALTFDDGPSGNTSSIQYTSAVIDALKAYDAKATFFVLGRCIEKCGQTGLDLVNQERSLGYEIGNHTWDHETWTKISADKLMEVLGKTDEKVKEATGGIGTTLLRPPGGTWGTKAPIDLPVIYWWTDTKDWDRASGVTPQDVFDKIKKDAKHGIIVLEHDIQYNTVKIVDKIVEWLDSQGFQMVTISELYEFDNIEMDCNHVYFSTTSMRERGN